MFGSQTFNQQQIETTSRDCWAEYCVYIKQICSALANINVTICSVRHCTPIKQVHIMYIDTHMCILQNVWLISCLHIFLYARVVFVRSCQFWDSSALYFSALNIRDSNGQNDNSCWVHQRSWMVIPHVYFHVRWASRKMLTTNDLIEQII